MEVITIRNKTIKSLNRDNGYFYIEQANEHLVSKYGESIKFERCTFLNDLALGDAQVNFIQCVFKADIIWRYSADSNRSITIKGGENHGVKIEFSAFHEHLPDWLYMLPVTNVRFENACSTKMLGSLLDHFEDLHHIHIKEIPKDRSHLSQITYEFEKPISLILGSVDCDALLYWIKQIRSLAHLEIRGQLTKLPDWIGEFKALESLTLLNTGINKLPEQCHATSLKSLMLMWNQISDIPKSWLKPTLETLKIIYEPISELPLAISSLERLRELSLSGLQLSEVPKWISNITRLESLDLSHNLLTTIDVIDSLRSLNHIDAHNNRLEHLPKSLFGENCKKHIQGVFYNNKLDESNISRGEKCGYQMSEPTMPTKKTTSTPNS